MFHGIVVTPTFPHVTLQISLRVNVAFFVEIAADGNLNILVFKFEKKSRTIVTNTRKKRKPIFFPPTPYIYMTMSHELADGGWWFCVQEFQCVDITLQQRTKRHLHELQCIHIGETAGW